MPRGTEPGTSQNENRKGIPERIFLLSQAENPQEVKKSLLDSAVSDGWISLLVNVNIAIFAGLISLTADFGAEASLMFLAIQLTTTFVGTVLFLFLQIRRQSSRPVGATTTESLLTLIDFLLMSGWGFAVVLFITPLSYDRSLLIIVMLSAAGIASAALNAKLLPALIMGRVVLFLPSIVYFLSDQPPLWGLLLCTLFFAFAVSIGIGYAIHVQHLHEANLAIRLKETSVLLEQQSFSLERSLMLEREAQENALKETRLREQFLHSISHDLNQPLGAMALSLKSLEQQKLPAGGDKAVRIAGQSLKSARSLIKSVSQLAWIKEHLPQPDIAVVALQPLMANIAAEAEPVASGKKLAVILMPTSVSVLADAGFLERVLRNLIHNAIQHTAQGKILFGVRKRGQQAEITIADTGAGISPDNQKRIFDTFYQVDPSTSRQAGNVGLGLSIVRDLVAAMNGDVTLASVQGKGSSFGVKLPVHKSSRILDGELSPVVVVPAQKMQISPISTEKVLLVEDRQDYLTSISDMLESMHYAVDTAHTPQEFAHLNAERLQGYALLILDFDLGDGLTAFDILDRSEQNLLPSCLIISQYDDPNMILHIKENGGRFLKKPFDVDDLESALKIIARGKITT